MHPTVTAAYARQRELDLRSVTAGRTRRTRRSVIHRLGFGRR